MTKKVLTFADWHIGSRFGLNHPEYVSQHLKKQSDCIMLHDCFNEVRDHVGKVDYIFYLGDICDGWNPKEHSDNRVQEEKYQVEAATKLHQTIQGSPAVYAVHGSHYHNGDRKLDEQFAKEIKAIPEPKYGFYAPADATIKIEDTHFHIAHFITVSKSTWQYRSTPSARELILAVLNDNPARIVLRAHAHYFVYAGFHTSVGMILPGMETQTPFMASTSPLSEPRWGAVLFTIDGDRFDWDNTKIWEPDMKAEVRKGVKG
jgi:uncharacterized protein (DUF2141 family)